MYTNGAKRGFRDFQNVVTALDGRYRDRTIWMKLSEIARYWAAKELTRIEKTDGVVALSAPYASPQFTVRVTAGSDVVPKLTVNGKPAPMEEVRTAANLKPGGWLRERQGVVVCFDLPKGSSKVGLG
jgi:hypothetical protein